MFTKRDKVKESAEFFVQDENTECLFFENEHLSPKGDEVKAVIITCQYNIKDINIKYNKYFVENFDVIKNMGYGEDYGMKLHNRLVNGLVTVSQKKVGTFEFRGHEASEIVNACEFHRDITSMVVINHKIKQN